MFEAAKGLAAKLRMRSGRRSGDNREALVIKTLADVERLVRLEQPRTALEHADLAIEAATGLSAALRAAALHARARARDALGDLGGAEADVEQASGLDPDVPARWLFAAQLAVSRQDWDTAQDRFQRTIAVAEAVGEPEAVPQAHWELANLALITADSEDARREFEAALAAAEALGDAASATYCELALADLDAEEGELDAARQRYARVRELSGALPQTGPRQVFVEPRAPEVDEATPQSSDPPAPPDEEPVLRITLSAALGEQVQVELWTAAGAAPRRVVVPFRFGVAPRTLERLRWYTEEYTARPLDPAPAIAAEVEQELELLGEALFEALLGEDDVAPITAHVRASLDRVRVEIVADGHAADDVPWELLRDPAGGTDLALHARAITRTTTTSLTAIGGGSHGGAMRILLVIARPEGRLDIGFRSVADPLVRHLTAASAPVTVDVLRPPTFERLREVVGAARAENRPYDLVHFDGHGSFEDEHGGLVFESEDKDEAGTLVAGDEIGAELRAGDVPLLVMNACRSAAGAAYGSVASDALEQGLAGVVAMRFNVYVPTAALFMGRLYGALGEGSDLASAVTEARRLLAERTERAGLPVVRDWCVPALYQATPVRLASAAAAAEHPGDAYAAALPPAPSHGFVGRDEVFVELEAAFVASPHVVLRAFAGAGKTTVATEFARWYARTGGGELELWHDVRTLEDEDRHRLDELAAVGGRVLLISDRLQEPGDLPLVPMPNLPGEEAYALALAVATESGLTLAPDAAMALVDGLRGHALAIELAVRQLASGGAGVGLDDVVLILDDLAAPANGSPAPWTGPLGASLELEDLVDVAVPVAQFRGYVSVPGLGALRGDDDLDDTSAALDALAARGILTRVNEAIYAIHPGLSVALAAQGRLELPGRRFAEAMAETASGWTYLAEAMGGIAPWRAEVENILTARRLASRRGWWPLVLQLMAAVNAVSMHGGIHQVWRDEVLDAAPDFVDPSTGEPVPGMEVHGPAFLAHLASVADMEGDTARVLRLRTADVQHRRAAAASALDVASTERSETQRGLVRRLAVGLTNLGIALGEVRDPVARDAMLEAAALAREIDDWRLEAQNRLDLGVYWMTVPSPPDFDQADHELATGYNLTIAEDPQLAGKLMTERGTVFYERGMASNDRLAADRYFRQAAKHLQLAVGLREPDAVLFHQLGQVHRQLRDYSASRAWFEQAIELRETDVTLGAGADARLHLAQSLEEAGLFAEALSFARSAEAVLGRVETPDPRLQFDVEQTVARLALRVRA